MNEREAVLHEFFHHVAAYDGKFGANAMADEIVHQRKRADRAERILAALREPSEEVVNALAEAAWTEDCALISREGARSIMLRVAVSVAEQEVDG